MIKVEIKKLGNSEIEITGIIPAGDFETERERVIKDFSEEVKINGFRPGNIPEKILIEKIGEEKILMKMAENTLNKRYPKILEENQLESIGRPEVLITKIARNNPLEFKIRITILPEIELADYKKIASSVMRKEEKIDVEEKEIDEIIEYLRKSRANKNEKGEITLPELNDGFARSTGKFKNLGDLRGVLEKNLIEEKKNKQREKKRVEVLNTIANASKIEVPKIVIEAEKSKMMTEVKTGIEESGLKWEDYLAHIKKTEEELKSNWEKDAINRSKFGLILREIAKREKIDVSEEEMKRELEALSQHHKNHNEDIDLEKIRAYTYGVLRNEKIFQFLESC
ncbi:MAG: trigger factor [Patescibacteria group bacterium]